MINNIRKLNKTNKTLLYNTLMAFGVRGSGLIVALFTIPAYMNYFSDQNVLGLWFTMLSLLTWVLTFDLGIGNGLRNRLIKPLVENDMESVKVYISSSYLISAVFIMCALVVGLVIFPFIEWNKVLNISQEVISKEALLKSLTILYIGVLVQFLLKTIYSILYALQKSAIPNFLSLISNVMLLIFVISADKGSIENNMVMLAIVNVVFTNIPLIIATIVVFLTKLRSCVPNPKYYSKNHAHDVLRLGLAFFWLQLMSLILTSTNEFLITWLASPLYVVEYQIYFKLFSLVGTVFTLAMIPIWSAVTKAHYEQNFDWITKLYKVLKYASLIFIICEFSLILVLQSIVNLWLGSNAIEINYSVAFVFGVSGSLYIWHSAITSIVNGTGKLKIQFILLTLGGIINIPIAYLLFRVTGNWISIVLANIISLAPYCLVQPFYIGKYLNSIRRNL